MALRVHPLLYRALWIFVAVIGGATFAVSLLTLADSVFPTGSTEVILGQAPTVLGALLGAAILFLAIRRLRNPLKPRPHPSRAFD